MLDEKEAKIAELIKKTLQQEETIRQNTDLIDKSKIALKDKDEKFDKLEMDKAQMAGKN